MLSPQLHGTKAVFWFPHPSGISGTCDPAQQEMHPPPSSPLGWGSKRPLQWRTASKPSKAEILGTEGSLHHLQPQILPSFSPVCPGAWLSRRGRQPGSQERDHRTWEHYTLHFTTRGHTDGIPLPLPDQRANKGNPFTHMNKHCNSGIYHVR